MMLEKGICKKCGAFSGDDWSQCDGKCPIEGSPHYDWRTNRKCFNFFFIKRSELIIPKTGDCLADHYWITNGESLLFYRTSESNSPYFTFAPMCNSDESVAERLLKSYKQDLLVHNPSISYEKVVYTSCVYGYKNIWKEEK